MSLYDSDKTSLGVVRPKEVLDVVWTKTEDQWNGKKAQVLQQLNLFHGAPKRLRKLRFKFQYTFCCEDDLRPRNAMILDWELGNLFWKESERLGSTEEAAKSVRRKYLEEMCADTKDVRFFVGTCFPHNTWLVLGVFWPPKANKTTTPTDDPLPLWTIQ